MDLFSFLMIVSGFCLDFVWFVGVVFVDVWWICLVFGGPVWSFKPLLALLGPYGPLLRNLERNKAASKFGLPLRRGRTSYLWSSPGEQQRRVP